MVHIMRDLYGIELVIFDCDGVLVDSEPLANEVLAKHATSLGWHMDAEMSQNLFKGLKMDQIHRLFEKQIGQKLDDEWIERYYHDTFGVFEKRLQPIAGIHQLIKRVKNSGRKICVASQGPMKKMQLTLRVTNLWDYFEGSIFSAYDVARPKPFPDLFLHAAKVMNVSPDKCCVIEDSKTGLKAAQAAKMHTLYFTEQDEVSEMTTTIAHMDDVLPQ